jgi:hypothetical protein
MTPRQPSHLGTCIAGALWCLLVAASPARAQSFFEFGGGWDYFAPPPAGESYNQSYNLRASLGRQISPRLMMRFDVIVNQYQAHIPVAYPCICNGPQHVSEMGGVTGFTGNVLYNLDERGIFYLSAGTGIYDTNFGSPAIVSIGVSAAAGVAVPVAPRLRLFAEARDHVLLSTGNQPPWFAPITIGLRY